MRFKKTRWGWWLVLLDREHFKVKLLRFRADGGCSMQKHQLRGELWCFLTGGGLFDFSNGRPISKMSGDAEVVPSEYWHKFTATFPTLVLEIQYGHKCDENDMIRI